MTNRPQVLRSSTPGQIPAAGTRLPGELWVTFPDRQLGYIDAAKTAQKAIAVRFFSTAANYVSGDFVVQAGGIWVANTSVAAGAFNPTQWRELAYLTDIPAIYVLPIASTSVLGGVKVDGVTVRADASGVLTAAGLVTVSSVAPSPVQNGALWYDLVGGQLYTWVNDGSSSQWVIAVNSGSSSGASIWVGDSPPIGPLAGALWFDSVGGQLYVWFNDGSSNQWVPTTNQFGGGYQPSKGVTDGSDAAPGQLGEVISSNVTTPVALPTSNTSFTVGSISLTAGDWDISGEVWIATAGALPTLVSGGIYPTTTLPPATTLNGSRASLQLNSPGPFVGSQVLALRPCRASLSATTTYYLLALATFPSGSPTATGNIIARRVR